MSYKLQEKMANVKKRSRFAVMDNKFTKVG